MRRYFARTAFRNGEIVAQSTHIVGMNERAQTRARREFFANQPRRGGRNALQNAVFIEQSGDIERALRQCEQTRVFGAQLREFIEQNGGQRGIERREAFDERRICDGHRRNRFTVISMESPNGETANFAAKTSRFPNQIFGFIGRNQRDVAVGETNRGFAVVAESWRFVLAFVEQNGFVNLVDVGQF